MLVLARSAGHRAIAVVNKVDLPQQLDEKLLKKALPAYRAAFCKNR